MRDTSASDSRYGPNPLVDDFRAMDPKRFAALASVAEPPKMFAGGTSDIPVFTASGIDPALLLQLPYGIRHTAASISDLAEVHRLFEEYVDRPDVTTDHPGLKEAQDRVRNWIATTPDPRSEEQRAADDDALYRQMMQQIGQDPRTPEEKRAEIQERDKRREELRGQLSALGNYERPIVYAAPPPPGLSEGARG